MLGVGGRRPVMASVPSERRAGDPLGLRYAVGGLKYSSGVTSVRRRYGPGTAHERSQDDCALSPYQPTRAAVEGSH